MHRSLDANQLVVMINVITGSKRFIQILTKPGQIKPICTTNDRNPINKNQSTLLKLTCGPIPLSRRA